MFIAESSPFASHDRAYVIAEGADIGLGAPVPDQDGLRGGAEACFRALPETIWTSSPTLRAPNSFAANAVGMPTQPCVAKPQRTLLPWIATPSRVSHSE